MSHHHCFCCFTFNVKDFTKRLISSLVKYRLLKALLLFCDIPGKVRGHKGRQMERWSRTSGVRSPLDAHVRGPLSPHSRSSDWWLSCRRKLEGWLPFFMVVVCCSITKSRPTLCSPMDCSTLVFPVLHYLLEFVQTHVHWSGDVIRPSHPLSPPSPPALNLSQLQGLFQWVSSLHQVTKILELQHQSFQWVFRIRFLLDWLVWLPYCPRDSQKSSAAAKSLQSCLTLCDPIDGSPPGSPVPGILQARILEWVAISFSNARKWEVKVKSLSCVRLLATPWTAAHQAPPSMGFSRQEYWSGVPLPSLKVFSSTTIQKHWFFGIQPSLWSNSHICKWLLEKP